MSDLLANDVITFWFEELEPTQHFKKSDELDSRIKKQFLSTWHLIMAGETDHWRASAVGRLAEIIVLDQFSRNMFRNSAKAFASDPIALVLAQEAVRAQVDQHLEDRQRAFVYMPYMHSESKQVHEQAMILFQGLPNLESEIRHKAVIDEFGRYPHRNMVLGRESTMEEIQWMRSHPGF